MTIEKKSMNIYSKPGTKIVYDNLTDGYEWNRKHCDKYLEAGKEYTVCHIDIGNFSSEIYLKEFLNISFNTVMFSNVEE